MDNILRNIIRVGKVSSVQEEKCTVRVTFEDRSKLVSDELPVLQQGTLHTKQYWLPRPNEQVVCLFLPIGNQQGFVVGARYSATDLPPVQSASKRHLQFEDGTFIEYDTETKVLTVDTVGKMILKALGGVQVQGNIHVQGDIFLDGQSVKQGINRVR